MGVLLAFASVVSAQNRMRATSAAPLLKEPGGIRLGSLVTGQSYLIGRARGTHLETTVEGWIPSSAAQATTRDGFDLAVIAGSGEAVRSAPNGSVVARVQEGTLLTKLGTRGNWLQVRRAGWVAKSALTAEAAVALQPSPAPSPAPPPAASASAVRPPAPQTATASPAPDTTRSSADAQAGPPVAGAATLRAGTAIVPAPDGRPIGSLSVASDVAIVERTRDWVKVRFEGWVKAADVAAEAADANTVTAVMLRDNPDRYVGQTVTWRLQFLAVQEADALRPEMPRGQSYILARGPLPESGFTYLMVTKEQAADFRRLAPLDEVKVEAVIRAGRTKYLPTPVLELVKVTR